MGKHFNLHRILPFIAMLTICYYYVPKIRFVWLGEELQYASSSCRHDAVHSAGIARNYFDTAKGIANTDNVSRDVFEHYGYFLVANDGVIPVVRRNVTESCDQIFDGWVQVARPTSSLSLVAPQRINEKNEFTLNGYVRYRKEYVSQMPSSEATPWTEAYVSSMVEAVKKNYRRPFFYRDGSGVFSALKYHGVSGQYGAVIGSRTPWVEAYLLVNNASRIVTVDYQDVHSTHPQISFLHAYELVEKSAKFFNSFDFIVTFSSLEHSGLGRYGDPIDAFGDVEEIRKIRCLLKSGGMLFMGVPTGADTVVFNKHRIYGRLRLPFMLEGFELLNVFHTSKCPVQLTLDVFEERTDRMMNHFVFVLRKPLVV